MEYAISQIYLKSKDTLMFVKSNTISFDFFCLVFAFPFFFLILYFKLKYFYFFEDWIFRIIYKLILMMMSICNDDNHAVHQSELK